MKILAFVDTHGNKTILKKLIEKADQADLLICAGDISNWGKQIKELLEPFEKLNIPLLIIPGNHETPDLLQRNLKNFQNVIPFHRAIYQLNEYVFIGYGGGGFSEEDKDFESFIKKIKSELKDKKIILITHAPPFGTKLDSLTGLGHKGCESYTKFIVDYQPLIHICGHLHETANKADKIKNTTVINPGPAGKLIKL